VILYLDTSALVKLYVLEPDSDEVRARVSKAERVATSRVAYPEARAAFARRQREGAIADTELRSVVSDLERDFKALVVVELQAGVARLAGELSERHALRGFDAIHVACALDLWTLLGSRPAFCSYDARQLAAAASEGLVD
jgi:predicted nucleic acid-binding protein